MIAEILLCSGAGFVFGYVLGDWSGTRGERNRWINLYRPRLSKWWAVVLLAVAAAAAQVAFAAPPTYNAQDTLRRAQVGTYSPRLAPPVKVEPTRKGRASTFDRLECKVDSSNQLICQPRRNKP